MTDKTQSIGKWTFQLQRAQTLQFHIRSEQETGEPIVIEGHDISLLLDYLYNHRELIYEATHDQETRRLEAVEWRDGKDAITREERQVERVFYIDNGGGRTRISIE
jgi:hypothetical protein